MKSEKNDSLGGKLIFTDEQKRRKWEEVDPNIKSFVFKQIYDIVRRIEDDLANELMKQFDLKGIDIQFTLVTLPSTDKKRRLSE